MWASARVVLLWGYVEVFGYDIIRIFIGPCNTVAADCGRDGWSVGGRYLKLTWEGARWCVVSFFPFYYRRLLFFFFLSRRGRTLYLNSPQNSFAAHAAESEDHTSGLERGN